MLSVIILSVFMLNLTEKPIMLSAVTLNVVMMSVVAPFKKPAYCLTVYFTLVKY